MEKLFGIDVSHWQGDMSIEQARNERDVKFAIIKAAGADDGKYKDGGRTGGRPFPVSYCREAV